MKLTLGHSREPATLCPIHCIEVLVSFCDEFWVQLIGCCQPKIPLGVPLGVPLGILRICGLAFWDSLQFIGGKHPLNMREVSQISKIFNLAYEIWNIYEYLDKSGNLLSIFSSADRLLTRRACPLVRIEMSWPTPAERSERSESEVVLNVRKTSYNL